MKSAIQANHSGDWDRAVDAAKVAEDFYVHSGNIAGAARSQMEIIYAYRRHSRATECVSDLDSLTTRIQHRSYTSFQVISDYERAVCQSMLGNFDKGWRLARKTISEAEMAHYPSLELRAKSLLSAMDSAEGRFSGAFQADADGLDLFWKGFFPPERGFQFYSDAALTAEQTNWWHVAALLQQEALSMLQTTDRFDFQALAHYHEAISSLKAGETSQAEKQFSDAYALFAKMRDGSSRRFVQASSEVELASIEISEHKLDSAQSRLENVASAIDETNSFVVKLLYFNTRARLERQRNRPVEEWKYVKKTIDIARQGFASLGSVEERWEWYQEVDQAYHRLIMLELEVKQDPTQALADWEEYRVAEIAPLNLERRIHSRDRLLARIAKIDNATFISFVVFPKRTNIWVADQRGIRSFSVNVDSEILENEAEAFLRLCSDRDSPLEKVRRAGSRLYGRLIKPIEHEITSDRFLAIEADGFLSRIPWAALVTSDGEYLGKRYMTASTPGLFFERGGISSPEADHNSLVAYPGAVEYEGKQYPPLPHAKDEADFVAALQARSIYLRDQEVTTDELLRQLPLASSFHFAGHAVNHERGGELLLADQQILSAAAIRRLNLRHMELVVLSACSTADSDWDITRSPSGLVEAFLASGARQVVASRWDIDSQETYEFSRRFHSSLQGGRSTPLAMRDAREYVRAKRAHPYYWASFELFGFAPANSAK